MVDEIMVCHDSLSSFECMLNVFSLSIHRAWYKIDAQQNRALWKKYTFSLLCVCMCSEDSVILL